MWHERYRIRRHGRRWLLIAFMSFNCAGAFDADPRIYEDFVFAVTNDRVDQVKSLLARGMDPDTVDPNTDPVLLVAARLGFQDTVNALLAARADVDRANRFGDTAIKVAALNGHLNIVRTLRQRGAAIDMPGWTPLIYAATGGRDEIVRYLLAQGANVNAAAPNGTTPLMMSVRESHRTTIELLLASGADVNHRNADGATALSWAQRNDDEALANRLKRAGAR